MQASFSDLEYAANKKQTRRDRFLAQMDAPRAMGAVCPPPGWTMLQEIERTADALIGAWRSRAPT